MGDLLVIDHKPLITIFGPTKGIPALSANRLQYWAMHTPMRLSTYKPAKQHGNADCQWKPIQFLTSTKVYIHPIVNLIELNQLTQLPLSAEAVKGVTVTEGDGVLTQVVQKIKEGWLSTELHLYFNH